VNTATIYARGDDAGPQRAATLTIPHLSVGFLCVLLDFLARSREQRKAPINFVLSIRLSACVSAAATGHRSVTLYVHCVSCGRHYFRTQHYSDVPHNAWGLCSLCSTASSFVCRLGELRV
jgi:hypothetical protein